MSKRRPTQWVPLSAYYFDDAAMIDVGEVAELLYVRMLAYAARTPEREGFITDGEVASRLGFGSGALSGPVSGATSGALSVADTLADHGLLRREEGGWRIASWLKWNASRDQALRTKASDRARKSAGTMRETKGDSTTTTAPTPTSGALSGPVSGATSGAVSAGAEGTEGTEEREKRAKRSPTRSRRLPETPLPTDWEPTSTHTQKAKELGLNLTFEAEKFRNSAKANDRRYRDWNAAFSNWLVKANEYAIKDGRKNTGTQTTVSIWDYLPEAGGDAA